MRQRFSDSSTGERGSIIVYMIMALVLLGLLIAYMSQGTQRGAESFQVDEVLGYLEGDIKIIEAAVGECIMLYPEPTDVDADGDTDATDNPNAPFPLYGTALTNGGAGTAIANIQCPGAPGPDGQRIIFNHGPGREFRLLSGSAYTVTYLSNAVEGIRITISRSAASEIWSEAISRLNSKIDTCKAEVDTAGGCANGCLRYWIKRRATSVATEGGCP